MDNPQGSGESGEIQIRGATVSSGYWRRPEETARAFLPDGWFRTGDVGVFDEQGYLSVLDSKKDMFISGGSGPMREPYIPPRSHSCERFSASGAWRLVASHIKLLSMATQNDTADGNDAFVSLGVLDRLVGYHLRRAYGALRTDFNREMDGLGMRQVQFAILSIIDANPGVSQGAIGRMLAIHPANMVSLINELIDRELIDRQPSRNDRRAGELSLTRTGRTLLKESLARIEHHEERLLSRLSSNDRKRLLELLRKVVD